MNEQMVSIMLLVDAMREMIINHISWLLIDLNGITIKQVEAGERNKLRDLTYVAKNECLTNWTKRMYKCDESLMQ
jgi:hypothetical protein